MTVFVQVFARTDRRKDDPDRAGGGTNWDHGYFYGDIVQVFPDGWVPQPQPPGGSTIYIQTDHVWTKKQKLNMRASEDEKPGKRRMFRTHSLDLDAIIPGKELERRAYPVYIVPKAEFTAHTKTNGARSDVVPKRGE